MADYTLYCFAQSGNSYKVALMLALCDADWAPRFVDYFNGETRTEEYRRINVMGEAPILMHAGRTLTQSAVILDYLAEQFGRFGWNDDDERREMLRWLLFDNHKLTSYTATYRFLVQFTDQSSAPATVDFGKRMRSAFKVLDAHLAGRSWVVGDRPTIVDVSLCGYLFFENEFGVDWSEFAHIATWLQRIKALPGWRHPYELMPGHPLPGRA